MGASALLGSAIANPVAGRLQRFFGVSSLRIDPTFSGIGVYRTEIFDAIEAGQSAPLAPMLREYATRGQVGGEVFRGDWTDVGTPERLAQLNGESS